MKRHPWHHINTVWLILVGIILSLLLYPDWVSRESVSGLLEGLGASALLVYIVLSLSRAALLIPCTPFVLAGAISFPQWPALILLISLAGVVAGALLVYSFPSFGDYGEFLGQKYPEKIGLLKHRMHGRYACWIVAGWSIFPLVSTDVICYVAGMTRMPFRKLVTALLVGKVPLVAVYVYLGSEIGAWLRL